MPRYVFREDEPLRIKAAKEADPQAIGEALERISDEAGGELQPDAVVNAARASDHVLHRYFEWRDDVAAEAYRLDQARSLIRIVRTEDVEAGGEAARAFLSIRGDNGVSYRSLSAVQKSEDFQARLIESAMRDLRAFEHRYRSLREICAQVAEARRSLEKKLPKRGEGRAAA